SRDVREVTCVWGDSDFKNVPGGAIEVYRRLNDLPLKPSIVVNSGYGRHVYYVFNKVLIGKDLLIWEELIRALRNTLQSDATVDFARRMRLPGTLNIKESTPALCHVCEEDTNWLRYSPQEVGHAFRQAAEQRGGRPSPGTGRSTWIARSSPRSSVSGKKARTGMARTGMRIRGHFPSRPPRRPAARI